MISNYLIYFCFFIFGVIIDIINNIFIKNTIKTFIYKKDRNIIFISFLLRMFIFLTIFVIIGLIFKKGLYFLFCGLLFSKIILLIKKCVSKNENINR